MTPRTIRRSIAFAAAAILTTSFAPQAMASPLPSSPTAPTKKPTLPKGAKTVANRWIVQVSGAATADGGTASAATAVQDKVLSDASSQGLRIGRTKSYTGVYNGMSVTATSDDADQLRSVPGVLDVWPVLVVAAPKPTTSAADNKLSSALAMTGADVAYSELGYTGEGIRVGVIDSGIDIDHPDLGGTGTPGTTPFPSSRVKWGYDFVGDAYNADVDGSTPAPDPNPDDCGGHGTHVAGIIGANGDFAKGGVRGVAPKVSFGAYRVFGCDGSSSTDVVLAAMDMTIKDHMNVVNMSLGDSYQSWPSYPTATAALTMQKAGVILVASAGNDGTDGSFTVGAPSVSDGAISVASFENTNIPAHRFTATPGGDVPYLQSQDAPQPPTSGSLPLIAAGPDGTATTPNTACTQISPDVSGKAALISRGGCTFYTKALAAQNAGAKAVVLYNNAPGLINVGLAGDVPITIPVVFIPQSNGLALAASLAAGAVSIAWADGWITTPNPVGGLVSDFSSYGLAADLSLKPDLGAPGGNILSTWPLEKGKYANESGTSMSSPHVTGAVALLLQAKPELKGKTTKVRELLQTTASIAPWSEDPASGSLEPVHRQGGGLIQIVTALTTKQTVSPGKISLGEGSSGTKSTEVRLTNTSTKPVTYKISKSDGVATVGSAITASFFTTANATMSAPATVTVPAKGSTTVRVRLTPPKSPATAIYGGWVTFTGAGATTLHIPFAGVVGDYQSVKVLTGDGLPTLGQLDANFALNPVGGKPVYTMQNFDYPFVLLHLDYPVSNLRIDIVKVGWRGSYVPIAPNYRSFVKTGPIGKDASYQYYYFDGTYTTLGPKGTQFPIANGDYAYIVTVTKALATPGTRNGTETWVSPTFTISNPT